MTYYSYPGIVPFSALLPALQPPALAAYDQGYAAGYMEGLKDGQRRAAGLAPAPAYSAACWGAPPAHPPPPAAQPGWRSGVVIEELPQGAPLPAPDGAGPPPPSDAEAPRSLELLHRLLVLRGSMHAQRLMQLEKELLGELP